MLQTKELHEPTPIAPTKVVQIFTGDSLDQEGSEIDSLLEKLANNYSWSERKSAALALGSKRDPSAIPALLDALQKDPFWMVRCAVIQALESIADDQAIPVLYDVAANDTFQIVRSYALKAIHGMNFQN